MNVSLRVHVTLLEWHKQDFKIKSMKTDHQVSGICAGHSHTPPLRKVVCAFFFHLVEKDEDLNKASDP